MKKNTKNNNELIVSLIFLMLAFIISILPTFDIYKLNFGHDLEPHTLAIKGIEEGIRYHNFPLYINYIADYSRGSCRYIVYPYLFMYIPAIIDMIVNNINVAFNIYIIIINFISLIIIYYSSYLITKDKKVSVMATIFSLLFFYRLFNIYDRQAFGEYTALVFYPLVIASIYNIFFDDKSIWYLLPLGLTCIVQSHVLTFFYLSLMIIVFCVINIKKIISNKKIFNILTKSFFVVLLLNLWTIVPLIQYYLEKKVGTVLLGQDFMGYSDIKRLFLITLNDINLFNSYGFESLIAYIFIFIIFIKIIYECVKYKKWNEYKLYIIMTLISFYFLVASLGFFNYELINNIKILHFIFSKQQWMYREIGRAGFFLAITFALSFNYINCNYKIKIFLIFIISITLSGPYILNRMNNKYIYAYSNIEISDYLPINNSFFENYDEVVIEHSNNINIIKNEQVYGQWTYEYEKNNDEEGFIIAPVNYFTGYVVRDELNNKLNIINTNGQIALTINNNKGKILIKFEPPIHWTVCFIISTLVLVYIIIKRIIYEIIQLYTKYKKNILN